MPILEADIALTDFFLFAITLILGLKLQKRKNLRKPRERWVFLLLFYTVSLSSLAGGIAHGFYSNAPESTIFRILWLIIFVNVGFATYSMTHVAAKSLNNMKLLWLLSVFLMPFFIYALLGGNNFLYCALIALFGQIIFLFTSIYEFRRGNLAWKAALLGCLATCLGMIVQVVHIGFENFGPSAIFHMIQAAGMLYYFSFAKQYLGQYST
ncbi:MAG: hypothetical protein KA116_10640 [Proteobacteria bacterium]|nr:hypothetical protein [Pseudomonadota bacterium]